LWHKYGVEARFAFSHLEGS